MDSKEIEKDIESIYRTLNMQLSCIKGLNKAIDNLMNAIEKDRESIQETLDKVSKEMAIDRDSINEDRERFIKHQINTTRDN